MTLIVQLWFGCISKAVKMSIYLVKNELNEEVSAYTDLQRAKDLAEQLQSATFERYCVEEVVLDSQNGF